MRLICVFDFTKKVQLENNKCIDVSVKVTRHVFYEVGSFQNFVEKKEVQKDHITFNKTQRRKWEKNEKKNGLFYWFCL